MNTSNNPNTNQTEFLSRNRPASRDGALISDELRRIIQAAHKTLDETRAQQAAVLAEDELSAAQAAESAPAKRQLFSPADFEQLKEWSKTVSSDLRIMVAQHIKKLELNGPTRRVARAPEPSHLANLLKTFPNFDSVTEAYQRRLALNRVADNQLLQLPPILLAGPPGVGKTAYSQSVAKLLDVPIVKIDMASISAGFSLTGLDIRYTTGSPGRFWQALQGECMSPIILLDEIEKFRPAEKNDGLGFMLNLLEPLTAKQFTDASIPLQLDASRITWIATCNSVFEIDAALRSRFQIFEIEPPSPAQMRAVVLSIHADLMISEDWAPHFEQALSEDVIASVQTQTPRKIRQLLINSYSSAVLAGRNHIEVFDIEAALGWDVEQIRPAIGFIH
jgi:ATP-dependent Lon protease